MTKPTFSVNVLNDKMNTVFAIRHETGLPSRKAGWRGLPLAIILLASIVCLWPLAPALRGAEESCASCGQQVSLSGDLAHRKDDASVQIQGATNNAAAFREEINGKNFTVVIAHLPAGKYTIVIGEVETLASAPEERLFAVTAGDVTFATNFDILATAGGARKVCYLTGVVEHEDDSIKGPLSVSFQARKNTAKFNTFEVKNDSGASVVAFSASELAEPFSAAAARPPEINEPSIWRDASQPLPARAKDLIRRMSLAEKVAQLQNGAPTITRLGLPAYNYWSEALHGVANNGNATVFPQAIGAAATWDPALLQQESAVIGVEGRAKFNDYAAKHNGDAKWFGGLTFWSPNINIFRDPRWGRGQETYGEDPFLSGTLGVAFIQGLQGNDTNCLLAMGCAKHFAVHSGPEPERHRFDAAPPERDLYETYLPQFEMAVREGHVGGVMGAYNSVYGVPCCASSFLFTDVLRKQWGFDGYIVSDCAAIHNIWGREEHHYVSTPEAAAAAAVKVPRVGHRVCPTRSGLAHGGPEFAVLLLRRGLGTCCDRRRSRWSRRAGRRRSAARRSLHRRETLPVSPTCHTSTRPGPHRPSPASRPYPGKARQNGWKQDRHGPLRLPPTSKPRFVCGIEPIPMEKPSILCGTSRGGAFHCQSRLPLAASKQTKIPWVSSRPPT